MTPIPTVPETKTPLVDEAIGAILSTVLRGLQLILHLRMAPGGDFCLPEGRQRSEWSVGERFGWLGVCQNLKFLLKNIITAAIVVSRRCFISLQLFTRLTAVFAEEVCDFGITNGPIQRCSVFIIIWMPIGA